MIKQMEKEKNRKHGRGLDSLIEDYRSAGSAGSAESTALLQIAPDAIDPNPFQPRMDFRTEPLEELMGSITRLGILQPLTVRNGKKPGRYELVIGERRLRASTKLGFKTVPCIVAPVQDERMLEIALMENLQRADLDPIETAAGYRALMIQCSLTQEELADRLSIGRSTVANALRLVDLPDALKENVSRGTLSAGHARAIAALPGESAQKALAARVARDSLTVRQTEKEVAKLKEPAKPPTRPDRPAYLAQVEDRLRKRVGSKVSIQETGPSRGRIVIDFYGEQDFERLLALFE